MNLLGHILRFLEFAFGYAIFATLLGAFLMWVAIVAFDHLADIARGIGRTLRIARRMGRRVDLDTPGN